MLDVVAILKSYFDFYVTFFFSQVNFNIIFMIRVHVTSVLSLNALLNEKKKDPHHMMLNIKNSCPSLESGKCSVKVSLQTSLLNPYYLFQHLIITKYQPKDKILVLWIC